MGQSGPAVLYCLLIIYWGQICLSFANMLDGTLQTLINWGGNEEIFLCARQDICRWNVGVWIGTSRNIGCSLDISQMQVQLRLPFILLSPGNNLNQSKAKHVFGKHHISTLSNLGVKYWKYWGLEAHSDFSVFSHRVIISQAVVGWILTILFTHSVTALELCLFTAVLDCTSAKKTIVMNG